MAAKFIINSTLLQLLNTLKGPQFEKNIPYMYVDTVGDVTVGVGHNLDANNDMLKLPFVVKRYSRHPVLGGDKGIPIKSNLILNRPATLSEIQNDYDFLKKHSGLGKYAAENLSKYTTLELQKSTIDKIFLNDLNIAAAVTKLEFGDDFNNYPATCQAALIDIAFNCGTFSSFKTCFVPAIKGIGSYHNKSMYERWKIASASSRRGQVSIARNVQTAKWLMDGALASRHVKSAVNQ